LLNEPDGSFPTDGKDGPKGAAQVLKMSGLEWNAKVQGKVTWLRWGVYVREREKRREAVSGELDPEATTIVGGALFLVTSSQTLQTIIASVSVTPSKKSP
jgi:hypothetical protein